MEDKKFYVVCMKWGNKFDNSYVNRLYNLVSKNLTLPFKFICFTDNSDGFNSDFIRSGPCHNAPPCLERVLKL